ncbi:Uncharacterised protein [uncultured archaeon]|nr:Uncharacterised protein [uncultured archaeon]
MKSSPVTAAIWLIAALAFLISAAPLKETPTATVLIIAAVINVPIAIGAYKAKAVSVSGAVAGFFMGFAVYALLNFNGYLVLLEFFVIGSIVSRHRIEDKIKLNVAQSNKGRRCWRHAMANSISGVAFAYAAATHPDNALPFIAAYVGSFAAAASDTASSELGEVYGGKPRLITTLKEVPIGTNGGVTIPGTLAGLGASFAVAAVAYAAGLIPSHTAVAVVTFAGVAGMLVDSFFGAALENPHFVGNSTVNFLGSVAGGLICLIILK